MQAGPLISTAMDHFVRGENWQKAIKYGEMAASNALNDGNSIEAGLIYQELKDLSSKHPNFRRIVDPNSYTRWLEHAQLADDDEAFNKAFKPLRRLTRAAGGGGGAGFDGGRSSMVMSGGAKLNTGRRGTISHASSDGVSIVSSPKRRMSMMEAISGGINSIFSSSAGAATSAAAASSGESSGRKSGRRTSASLLGDFLGVGPIKEKKAELDPFEALSVQSARIPRRKNMQGSGDSKGFFSTASGTRLHVL